MVHTGLSPAVLNCSRNSKIEMSFFPMILNKDRDGTKGQIRSKLVKIGKFTIKI